jgi:hypothetical protein
LVFFDTRLSCLFAHNLDFQPIKLKYPGSCCYHVESIV